MTDQELLKYAGDHVAYEIGMCAHAALLLRAMGSERTIITNVVIEAYALHLRNLIEFVYWKPIRDDVNAVHYVRDKSEWLNARGEVSAFLGGVKDRADKQVAHLTEKRYAADVPEKRWEPITEIRALLPGLRLFRTQMRPELVHPKVDEALASLSAFVRIDEEGERG
jgi:hypothetical protein